MSSIALPARLAALPALPRPRFAGVNQSPAAPANVPAQGTLPSVSGLQLAQALRAQNPSLLNAPLFGARKKVSAPTGFEPSLAVKIDFDQVQYPVFISPKIDGNRGYVRDGKVMGRGTPIPNELVQQILGRPELEGMDGELIASTPTDPAACRKATSFLRSKKPASKSFEFWVFDLWNQPDKPFSERARLLKARIAKLPADLKKYVKVVPQIAVNSQAEILQYEKEWLAEGYEGVIARKADSPYLQARSTMVDQAFMKLKRFYDSEAKIVGFRALDPKSELAKSMLKTGEINADQLETLGENSQALGGYTVRDLVSGAEFNLGAGQLTFQQRQTLWKNRAHLEGKIVKYKYFPVGMNEESKIPRHPTFLNFREDHDMPADLKTIAARFNKAPQKADD